MGKRKTVIEGPAFSRCGDLQASRARAGIRFLSLASGPPTPIGFSSPHCLLLGLIKVQRLHLPFLPLSFFFSESRNQTAQRPRAQRPQHIPGLPPAWPPLACVPPPPATASWTRSPVSPPSRRCAAAGPGDLNDWGWGLSSCPSSQPPGD
ncbi:hypothetical protein mRhiFer1_008062 [Rhinolophus ferrumequinum]|uniref:Uncharacterized protein n=1 Tax=Rhinolophus ferrumequinum TaxID=59479 RepID=A0A7J7WRG9_RHIFE|nr:hypothetical protein mRhiFer1_008062 [Rhinolophus ferrumequinum]